MLRRPATQLSLEPEDVQTLLDQLREQQIQIRNNARQQQQNQNIHPIINNNNDSNNTNVNVNGNIGVDSSYSDFSLQSSPLDNRKNEIQTTNNTHQMTMHQQIQSSREDNTNNSPFFNNNN